MFLRALRVCSPVFLQEEFERIYSISEKLKYPKYFIDCALQKAQKTFYSVNQKEPFNHKNLLVLPYSDYLKNVPRFCKNFDINVVFRFPNTLRNIMIKNSPEVLSGCIYEIPCKDCSSSYYGQSGKGIATRIKQHQYSVRTGQMSNALFLHTNHFNHRIDWDKARVILYCNNSTKRNIIESSLIKTKNDLINVSQGMYKLDSFVVKEIFKTVPL